MRTIKLVSALITLLALTSIAAATANATETLWKWNPGKTGTTFTGKSGEATLQEEGNKATIVCTSSTATGVITAEQTLGLTTIDFKGCKAAGIAAVNSLGDAKETILTHVELHNCTITAGSDAGIIFKPLPLHLEIPLTSELKIVEGSFIALISPDKKATTKFELNIKQTEGKQEIKKCEGGTEEKSLTTETNENGKKIPSGEGVAKGTGTFEFKEKEPQEATA